MKRTLFLVSVSVSLLLFSCEKDYLVPQEELPEWLISKIENDEQIIEESPKYYLASGAWARYEWNTEFYFEYWNPLSSTFPHPISQIGDTLEIYANDANSDYCQEKCCWEYVWKGPKYKDWMYEH